MVTEVAAVAAPAVAAPAVVAPAVAAVAAAPAVAAPAVAASVAVVADPAAITAAETTLATATAAAQGKPADSVEAKAAATAKAALDALKPAPAAAARKAPESYVDFKAPDGITLHADVVKEVKGLAKDLDLTQADAQKLIDKIGPAIAKSRGAEMQALVTKTADGWRAAALADAELGGEKAAENMAVANKTFDAFGTPALREVLSKTGLGDHPELLRWAFRIGKQIGPDGKFVSGNAAAVNKNGSLEERAVAKLWPTK